MLAIIGLQTIYLAHRPIDWLRRFDGIRSKDLAKERSTICEDGEKN